MIELSVIVSSMIALLTQDRLTAGENHNFFCVGEKFMPESDAADETLTRGRRPSNSLLLLIVLLLLSEIYALARHDGTKYISTKKFRGGSPQGIADFLLSHVEA